MRQMVCKVLVNGEIKTADGRVWPNMASLVDELLPGLREDLIKSFEKRRHSEFGEFVLTVTD